MFVPRYNNTILPYAQHYIHLLLLLLTHIICSDGRRRRCLGVVKLFIVSLLFLSFFIYFFQSRCPPPPGRARNPTDLVLWWKAIVAPRGVVFVPVVYFARNTSSPPSFLFPARCRSTDHSSSARPHYYAARLRRLPLRSRRRPDACANPTQRSR